MEIKLKPCPFCGAEARMKETAVKNFAYVICTSCACQTDLFSKKQAAQHWNRRVTDMREEDDGK